MCSGFYAFSQSQPTLDSLALSIKSSDDSPEKLKSLIELAGQYKNHSQAKTIYYYKKAGNFAQKLEDTKSIIVTQTQIALVYNKLGEKDSSNFYLEKAKETSIKYNTADGWLAYYMVNYNISMQESKFQEAKSNAEKALEYAKNTGKKENIAGCYLNLANSFIQLKQYEKSVTNFYDALTIFTNIQNKKGVSYCYNNLSIVLMDLGQHEEALKNIKKSVELKKELNDIVGISTGYQQLSACYYNLNNYTSSIDYANKSIKINKELKLYTKLIKNYWQQAKITEN